MDFFWDSELFTQDSSLKDTQQTSQKVFQRESEYVSASVYSKDLCTNVPSTWGTEEEKKQQYSGHFIPSWCTANSLPTLKHAKA